MNISPDGKGCNINNPESLVVVALGLFMVVLGFKGKTDNVIAAVKGQPYGNSTLQ
jgi:hypothetical protein